jgi:uncharacterized protein (DUF1684 family)
VTVTFGAAVAQVADREGQTIVRPRHPDSPNLRAYRGTPCYPPDPGWVLPARFQPYPVPDGDAVGEVVFSYDGREHRLVAWGEDDDCLWILFRDCAYTDFATCPVSPAANTLPFAVEAGEQTPTMAFTGDAPVRP